MEENASQFIAKNIVALQNGQEIGYILNLCFDESLTKLNGFIVVDDEEEKENFLSIRDVRVFGEDCIFIDSALSINLSMEEKQNNPIGKKVYDSKGAYLGRIQDVLLQGRRVKSFVLKNCEIPARSIFSCGVDCFIFGIKKRKKQQKDAIFSKKINFLPKIEAQSTLTNSAKIGGANMQKIQNPKRIILTPSDLLNKTATKDIFGLNNELIIKKGQTINQNKIEKAKIHGKLNLLIINSK